VSTDDEEHPVYGPLSRMVDAWCERRDLGHLAALLPAYVYNFGLTDGWAELAEALRTIRAQRNLPDDEQAEIERLVVLVERVVYRT
jgi:hypothetical protein